MNTSDIEDRKGMIAIAEKLGEELSELEARNKRRRAKGRKPLPDPQEREDAKVLQMKYRTGDATTVDGAMAMRMFEMRKAQMEADNYPDDDDDPEDIPPTPQPKQQKKQDDEVERAQKEAEAVRKVEDMKAGRIDHAGNWSDGGQKLEGGDDTSFPSSEQVWGEKEESYETEQEQEQEQKPKPKKAAKVARGLMPAAAGLNEFKQDLYERLRVSFEALENTLSDLQGRVAEIVTASAKSVQQAEEDGKDEFKEMLARKVPVTFDVNGTKMTFDAITVFHAPPCITIVSKEGSATIMPRPGAQLRLTYEMDGEKYADDLVTFLGTRFDLPMFGLSFVGFIREEESNMIDVAAGVEEP